MKRLIRLTIFCCLFLTYYYGKAQSPGLIVEPRNGNGITFLNPNGDKYSSATATGFTTSDTTQSEIPYKTVPAAITEPIGDQNGGANGGPTDFVPCPGGTGFYAFYDGTNVIFRFRTGGTSNGSRGYSVLIDTDLRMGNTGFYADPNYLAQSASRSGNPGFELEIVYEGNKRVAVYNVDGTTSGILLATYSLNTHSQISVALTKTSNNADYFTDFGVPVSVLGNPQYIRMVGTTVNSASSALLGTASDVFGINDLPRKNLENNWRTIIDNQCGFPVSALSINGSGICVCTPRPTVNSPIGVGANITVTGMWNRLDPIKSAQAVITLYKNSTLVGTVIANTGVTWSIVVPSITSGDTLYAKAQASPEFMCLQSDPVVAGCVTTPASPIISCASTNAIQGTIPLNSTVQVYQVTGTSSSPLYTQLTGGISYTVIGSSITFTYYGGTLTANPCANGTANLATGSYAFITNTASCLSTPTNICIYGSTQNSWNNMGLNFFLSLSTPIYSNETSVSGSGAVIGDLLRLYINDIYAASITAAATTFTFNNISLQSGDQLRIVAQGMGAGACMTASFPYTVTCLTPAPTIFADTYLTTDNAINGFSSSLGTTVSLYRGTSPTGTLAGTTTVASDGTWIVNGLTLVSGETYYAVQNAGCNSAASNLTTIVPPTVLCPVISGSYTESSPSVSGTLPSSFTGTIRLYLDGVLIGSTSVTNATAWSIAVNQDLVNYSDKLFPRGVLTITAQTPGSAEKMDCPSTATITCDIPSMPSATPNSVTITQGQTATFIAHNTSTRYLYSLIDVSDSTYGTSSFGNGGNLNILSYPFNNAGTYSLKVCADNIAGPGCRATENVTVVVNNIVLPVKFINFSAKADHNILLTWIVSNEIDVKYYQVEMSRDCINFNPIGKVNYQSTNRSTNTYKFTDHSFSGYACYRIIQVNTDGKISHSDIINVTLTAKKYLQVNPNPAKDKATLFIPSETERVVSIELQDLEGKKVMLKKVQLYRGNNAVTLYDLTWAKGTYIVKVYDSISFQYIKLVLQ